ncbi:MAG: DoxX family protein [Bacteroidota bacterium]
MIIRLVLGLIFLMQGYGKVFTWGIDNVYNNVFVSYEGKLPKILLWATCYYTSYIELIGGLLLIFGLFKDYALYALGSVLIVVSFGHGLSSPIWDMTDVMFRLILLATLLLAPRQWDSVAIDSMLSEK